ncbi:DUF4923 family protein [Prevotella sp. E13-17]|uniref:DUF4923 family protein n=1 Tax=Prevotella sp. E13-17 TaxID=2913616 RepID=UPI001ED9E4A1|nr:DUF4923 family protein [Prevotella sp. E13-17]UKK51198.1 DUF4923 family protein [Prevotella sp. E13-17]
MKKNMMILAAAAMTLASCGSIALNQNATSTVTNNATTAATSVLGSVLEAATNGQALSNMFQSVLGLDKMTEKSIVGTWKYSSPGCAFTSQQLLAQAGGEIAAQQIKEKMLPTFTKLGVKSSNTTITFNDDKTFSAQFAGKKLSGTYTFEPSTGKVVLSTLLLNITCYAKKNADGIGLLFESTKLLTLFQTMSALSGNKTMSTISDLSKNYDGLRMGFDFK